MSDLVSRQEVNKVVDELEVYTVGRLNTQKVEISVLQLQRFINALKEIPTAYNVGKVAAELEEMQMQANKNMQLSDTSDEANGYGGQWLAYGLAIDIVKRGGVE